MKKNLVNKEHIEGYLFDYKLEEKVCGPTAKNPGAPYIAGTIDVAVDDEGMNVIQTHFTFVSPVFSSGKTNTTYGVLQKIIAEGKTFTQVGAEATKVAIDTSLALNDFYTDNEQGEQELVSAKRNEGGFVSFVNALNPDPDKRHTFEFDMVITGAVRVDANEERGTSERVDVKGAIFAYGGKLLPITISTNTEGGMDYFEGLGATSSEPIFTKITGLINNITQVSKKEVEGAFGGSKVDEVKRNFKEWNITWAQPDPYEFGLPETITADELKTAQQNRETYLANELARRMEYLATKGNAAPVSNGAASIPQAPTPTVAAGSFKF